MPLELLGLTELCTDSSGKVFLTFRWKSCFPVGTEVDGSLEVTGLNSGLDRAGAILPSCKEEGSQALAVVAPVAPRRQAGSRWPLRFLASLLGPWRKTEEASAKGTPGRVHFPVEHMLGCPQLFLHLA